MRKVFDKGGLRTGMVDLWRVVISAVMRCPFNTLRPGYLFISNRDACCVAGLLVNKWQSVQDTKLPLSVGHFPLGYIEWLLLLRTSHVIMLPLFRSFSLFFREIWADTFKKRTVMFSESLTMLGFDNSGSNSAQESSPKEGSSWF